MAKCSKCGRSGWLVKTDSRGMCSKCIESAHAERIAELKRQKSDLQHQIDRMTFQLGIHQTEKEVLQSDISVLQRKIELLNVNISGLQPIYDAIQHAIHAFYDRYRLPSARISEDASEVEPILAPRRITKEKIEAMSAAELKRLFQTISHAASLLISADRHFYEDAPSGLAVYQLVTLGLNAEIDRVLSHLYLWDAEEAVGRVKLLTKKYLSMALIQNPSFAPQLKKTVGQLEYFYIQLVSTAHAYRLKYARLNPACALSEEALTQNYHNALFLTDISSNDPFHDKLPTDHRDRHPILRR